jgi:hypothetical protein
LAVQPVLSLPKVASNLLALVGVAKAQGQIEPLAMWTILCVNSAQLRLFW